MLTSFLISLREGLEAALVIGIVLGALRRTGRTDLRLSLWSGVASATLLSLLTALFLRLIGRELEGVTEEIYEGATLLLAAGVLTWMIFWMFRQSRHIKPQLENNVRQAANHGGGVALFLVAFIAVLREGVELALYLTAVSFTSSAVQTLLGTTAGLLAAASLGYLIYTATIRLNLQRFFQVTGVLLILFAAGMVAHGIAEFNAAGIIPTLVNPVWNLSSILDDRSLLGMILGTLFGYHSSPSLTQALGYSGYILLIFLFYVRLRNIRLG